MFYESESYGKFIILHVENHLRVQIQFVSTGHTRCVQMSKVRTGQVKDPMYPKIYGLGYYGVGEYVARKNNRCTVEYNRWFGMLERCYDEKAHVKHPQYIDCTVCEEWHNFQVFAKWFEDNRPDTDDISKYHLDKDIRVLGNKVYSPDTCSIVEAHVNLSFSNKNNKLYNLISPTGSVCAVTNVTAFANARGVQPTLLWKVIKGQRNHHKGWTLLKK